MIYSVEVVLNFKFWHFWTSHDVYLLQASKLQKTLKHTIDMDHTIYALPFGSMRHSCHCSCIVVVEKQW